MLKKAPYQICQRKWFSLLFILGLLLFAGCSSAPEMEPVPTTPVAAPVTSQLPAGVEMAHDATIAYLTDEYDVQLPARSADWSTEYSLVDDLLGEGAYRLTADSCILTISNPLMAPDSIIYYVVLDDAEAGIHWEGSVDCQGHVFPAWSPPRLSEDEATAVPSDTINIVQAADLHKTVGIEVCKLDCASYTPHYTIGSPKLIAALVETLDSDLPLRPHVPCPAVYQLRFVLEDGQYYDFGYTCQMMSPAFLRGGQEFWMGQDAVAPDLFNGLMLPLIEPALAGSEL